TMPEAKPKSSKWIGYAAKIAAGIMIVMATWYGATSIKIDRALQLGAGASSTASRVSDAVSSIAGGAAAARAETARAPKPQSQGVMASVRQSIARRAAVQVTDNLREGMEAWGAPAKTYPAGWSRNADGFVRVGSMAMLGPTKSFTDYRLEFFGQIESKSIGWTVRSKDSRNYHAMKFTMLESGLRPLIAMVHYNVIDGKPGRKM